MQAADVFAQDVEFKIDLRSYLYVVEVGVFVGKGNDAHLERVGRGFAYGAAYAVDGDGDLVEGVMSAFAIRTRR